MLSSWSGLRRSQRSFPTRRSSDLSPAFVSLRLEPVTRVRLTSLAGDFASCIERSQGPVRRLGNMFETRRDRKSTRLNSSHLGISYAVFCLKKKRKVH